MAGLDGVLHPSVELMFDVDQLQGLVISQATAAVRRAAEFAVGRAKHHAPVRALFKRDRRGDAFPTGFKTIRSESRYKAFRRSKERRSRIDIEKAGAKESALIEQLREQTGGIERTRQDGSGTGRRTSSEPFSGHSNTFFPVLRQGRFKLTGDIRRFDPKGGGLTYGRGLVQGPQRANPKFGSTIQVIEGKNKSDRESIAIPSKEPRQLRGKVTSGRLDSRLVPPLSARGRFEVRRAQRLTLGRRYGADGSSSRFGRSSLFEGRVGGRLRGEIRLVGPERHSGAIWFYVVSPTPYAEYQEFGTGHNRASPYLRPALYESRSVLISEVRAAMKDIENRGLKAGTAMAALESQPGAQDQGH